MSDMIWLAIWGVAVAFSFWYERDRRRTERELRRRIEQLERDSSMNTYRITRLRDRVMWRHNDN